MSARPYLKVSLFIKKLPSISHEQFRAHWKGPHVDIAMANDTFVHILPELKEQAKQFGNTNPEFDGIAEVWLDNVEAWKEIAANEDFVAKILPDEKLFLQHPSEKAQTMNERGYRLPISWADANETTVTVQLSVDHLVIPEKA